MSVTEGLGIEVWLRMEDLEGCQHPPGGGNRARRSGRGSRAMCRRPARAGPLAAQNVGPRRVAAHGISTLLTWEAVVRSAPSDGGRASASLSESDSTVHQIA